MPAARHVKQVGYVTSLARERDFETKKSKCDEISGVAMLDSYIGPGCPDLFPFALTSRLEKFTWRLFG